MEQYQADLHIHSVLSPCGDLGMSPTQIIEEALRKKIDILGITDHNSTLHAELMVRLGKENGILVLPGTEVNTKEEIHCLTFFENLELVKQFQKKLDNWLPDMDNKNLIFGEQVVVDENEHILYEEERLLIAALKADIHEIEKTVRHLNGLFIPAHINRPYNSILSQLGFIPEDLNIDAIEISYSEDINSYLNQHPELTKYRAITNSDAHYLDDIGRATTFFKIEELSFSEIRKALEGKEGRETIVR